MTKQDYLRRLAHHLSFYDINIQEVLGNYNTVIEELLDEGLC